MDYLAVSGAMRMAAARSSRHFIHIADYGCYRPELLPQVYTDIKHGEAYRLFDHGEYNLFNPIAREDLSEFIVNLLFDAGKQGRIFPVGGPWTEC